MSLAEGEIYKFRHFTLDPEISLLYYTKSGATIKTNPGC
jgi:hypothetical protein